MDFGGRQQGNEESIKIRQLKIRESMNVQHDIIEIIEERRSRWFGAFVEDDKWQNSKNDTEWNVECSWGKGKSTEQSADG